MTTETPSKNTTTTDNKAIFAPLGKYAVIAVIMVSIIVTTAIMLEKQFNTIDQQVAELETEVAESNAKKLKPSEDTASTKINNITISVEAELQTSATVEVPTADVLIATKKKRIAITEETQKDSSLVAESTATTIEVNPETTLATSTSIEQTAQASPIATIKQTHTDRQATLTDRNKARKEARQVRIETFKLEQKKHMTELFARIKTLESKQLGQYKASQQNQVVSLRKQLARQQKMIEALVLRNKDLYELRSANTQRNQSNRERILNRI